ncbi:MAG TPA: GNAT family N-acetyltransferase, partial [Humisphaera sp.]|nr:GNAT family N-acetyltransferase [Humisphaera sp.]
MKIDRLTEHDLPAALRLSTQAGWNQLEADWRRLITLWPQGCFAGRKDGKLIATATLATYGQSLGWIGMVLVDERHRGHGFGGALLAAALLAAKELGVQTVGLDATDLGWPVYLRRGFRDVGGIDRWVCSPARCAGPASRGTII